MTPSTNEAAPVAESARVRNELRRLRNNADLTQQQVADALDWSVSKVIRIESGISAIRTTDLMALLNLYRVADQAVVDSLISSARTARVRTWRNRYRKHIDPKFFEFLGQETAAQRIQHFALTTVPDLLRTEPYTRILARALYVDGAESDRMTDLCLERQRHILTVDNGPILEFLLDEAVLRRLVGTARTMHDQMKHLIAMAKLPNVSIRVIAFAQGARRGGSFGLLDMADGRSAAFVERRFSGINLSHTASDVTSHREYFGMLAGWALPEADSASRIGDSIDTWIDG